MEVQQDAGVGALSPRLWAVVAQLAEETPAVTARALVVMRASIPEYQHIEDSAVRLDIEESVLNNVQLWFKALLSGLPPQPQDLEFLIAFGRRRVHQGVTLQSLLQAFRTGSRVLWDVLLERAGDDLALHQELLFKVSPYILLHFDLLGQTIGQAYTAEQQHRTRWRDRLRHELSGVVFSHPDDLESYREHAAALGLDVSLPHLALALRVNGRQQDVATLEALIEPLSNSVSRVMSLPREGFLRALRHGHLLVWVPLTGTVPPLEAERKCALLAETLIKAGAGITAVGVGLPDFGARGWRRSAEQALKALEIGLRVEPSRPAARYLDIALDDALSSAENVMRFFEGMIERLATEPHLLKTLQAFFEHRQHRKAVAGALNIHPNTLSYRLDRIETLMGGRLDDMGWLSRLHAALRLRQMAEPMG